MIFEPNEYFKQIAISHVDIAHTTDKPAYFREYSAIKILFNNSDFLDNMRYAKRFALVSQFNKEGNFAGINADNKYRNYSGAIYLISRVIDKSIDQAFEDTNSVLEDIIAKMENDIDAEVIPMTFRLNDISVHSLGQIADGYYGLVAFLNYSDFQGACKPYNSDKWK